MEMQQVPVSKVVSQQSQDADNFNETSLERYKELMVEHYRELLFSQRGDN